MVTLTSEGQPPVTRTLPELRAMIAKLRGEDSADLFFLRLTIKRRVTFTVHGHTVTATLEND